MRTAFKAGALAALALGIHTAAPAGPSDYVATPIVEEGEREIDFKAGHARLGGAERGSSEAAQSIGLGYGATSWWFTEFYAKWHKEPGASQGFDAWEWENKFQLTETGRYPVDLGLLVELERPKDRSEGYELRWGPLLQMEFGPSVQANLNLLFEKHYRSEEPSQAELGYQWQLKYRWRSELEPGVQGFGNLGPWKHWSAASEQSHIAGPALFGRVRLAERQTISWNAALLFGLNDASPRRTLRVQAEFEF